ncbi:glycosyltransferase family 2 protein [Allorhizobium taibaishanense]|uniref:NDP-sugar pyrophosphorylase family protein n=1 Tax=Allorhizobium taibaishanense TaxID=887144 RepID=A0A1Q9A0S8_9HYPH|nr:glycosyltransferase family 2 protein [Allorhizobium taibaishanense]MBB4007824.1 NDP-sugar pyrophosphorylase family protein [Allorhizobium taibaishanense]OLP48165.1 nucleotidyl transferase [Allorhizobium taibaishanense]
MQILIPIAATSPFFDQAEFYFPKPLVDLGGKTMIEHSINALRSEFGDAKFVFLVRQEDIDRFSIDTVLQLRAGEDVTVIPVSSETDGALCTCLLAVDHLDLEEPILIANGDQVITSPIADLFEEVKSKGAVAGVVTFPSVHPRWSYVRLDDEGFVSQSAEKRVISENAIAGLYYYETAQLFIESAMSSIRCEDRHDGKYFISSTLNQIIIGGGSVSNFSIPAKHYHSFYTPEKYKEYVEKFYGRSGEKQEVVLVVPGAGEGSRFAKEGWLKPKPFIDVDGKPMIERVLENVRPRNSKVVTLLRAEHIEKNTSIVDRIGRIASVQSVEKLTEGTLCTVMLARKHFNDSDMVIVANSDQLIDFSVDDFVDDCINRDLDGSILVFKDAELNPKWSFAKINNQGLVEEVAEKKAISEYATVGVYLFRRADALVKATIDMIANNDRINNEFYTCPAYNYMIDEGARIGIYEVEREAMHGLGTPEDMRAFFALKGMPNSKDEPLQ